MTTETITIYTVNEAGLGEIRDYLVAHCNHDVDDRTVDAYASEIEESLANSGGENAYAEIRASHSKSGNPLPFNISDGGWDATEEDC